MEGVSEILIVIVGGDALAERVCEELMGHSGQRVTLLWNDDRDVRARVERLGATFAPIADNEREALLGADVLSADVIIALTEDDHFNLRFALTARDLNASIRLVMRQFNRTLGRKIEQNLADCSVISLSSVSAATYASVAVDPACFYGLQFPDIDGPLTGFFRASAQAAGVAGQSVADAEAQLDARIVAHNGRTQFPRDQSLRPDDELTYVASVRPATALGPTAHARRARSRHWFASPARVLRGLDPLSRWAIAVAICTVFCGTIYFAFALHLDPLSAAYFVIATMTTTGFGDISATPAGPVGELAAIALMLAGLSFSGIFIAILSSRFTQAQYVAMQGLRPVSRRGHIVVCGAGNVGSRVIDFLLQLRCEIVVIETHPTKEIVDRARYRQFDLLTGDASKDETLDLCNIAEAAALLAITQGDTLNLEVALGARARAPDLPIVMRVQHESFQKSVRTHFDFDRTYGTAALAAPVLAGLARSPGVRGRVTIGEREYSIVELVNEEAWPLPLAADCVPLATWRDGRVVRLDRLEDARPLERLLMLYPLWQLRRDHVSLPAAALARNAGQ